MELKLPGFDELKEKFKKQVQEAYRTGANEGAISPAFIIYDFLVQLGLEKSNIIFNLLKDIAKKHGCEDLDEYAKKIKQNNDEPKDKYQS